MKRSKILAALVVGMFVTVPAYALGGPGGGGKERQNARLAQPQAGPVAPQARQPAPSMPKPAAKAPQPAVRAPQPAPEIRKPAAEARHPAPETRRPEPEARKPEPQVRRPNPEPKPARPVIRHAKPDAAALARRLAEERRRALEEAQELARQADEMIRRAGELEEARTVIIEKVREIVRALRKGAGKTHRPAACGKSEVRKHSNPAIRKLLDQAKDLAEARDRLLTAAAELKAKAQRIMESCTNVYAGWIGK